MNCVENFDPVKPVIYLDAAASNGSGTKEAPFGDILDGIAKAKELGIAGAEHITLNFGAGDYSLTETVCFSGEAFGGASLELVCDNGQAVIGAWLPVTSFTETLVNGVKAWVGDMPKLKGETVYSHQFFNADYKRLSRPRFPKNGFLKVAALVDDKGNSVDTHECGDRASEGFNRNLFHFNEGDILEGITRVTDVQFYSFHYWNTQRRTLGSIDYGKRLIEVNGNGHNFIESDRSGARYYLDNVFEALDTPGEVYNDRQTGKLYYIPHESDDINNFTVYVSTIDTLLVIDGMNGTASQSALTLKNIGFVGSDWKLENKAPGQAESMIPASIQILNSSYLTFENCTFDHIGNYALDIKTYVNNVIFDRCSFSDIGAGGVRIYGKNVVPVTEEVPHDITITDCTVRGYGKVFGAAIGMHIMYAHHCKITHNEISDGLYSAISVGWVWGYTDHATSNILIEKNHIYNIGQGILSDMGGIYMLGVQPGSVLRGNLIHDVMSYVNGYGGWAYYTDEGSSDILIEKNIGYNCSDSIYHHHYGAENTVRNNIFAFAKLGVVKVTRVEERISFSLERNILVNDFAPIYYSNGDTIHIKDDSNLMWDIALKGDVVSMIKYPERLSADGLKSAIEKSYVDLRKVGLYNNAKIADPMFADISAFDFTLAENSPAYEMGFEPIDMSDIGPRN